MTIQKLSTVLEHGSKSSVQNHSDISPKALSLSFQEHVHVNQHQVPSKNWLKFGYVTLAGTGFTAATTYIFKKYLSKNWHEFNFTTLAGTGLAAATYYGLKKYLSLNVADVAESKKELKKRSFVDKFLIEACEISKITTDRFVAEGDQFFNQNHFNEAEKSYANALKAISGKDVTQEATCAKKLGTTYLKRANPGSLAKDKKEECMKAAGLLNYALLLAKNQKDQEFQREIIEKLVEVEQVLCSLCKPQSMKDKRPSFDEKNRQRLDEIRNSTKDKLDSLNRDPQQVEELFKAITSEMKVFIADLIEQSIEVLGNPPDNCEFAVIGFGSMAREEMTPFSDLEFAILIEEGKETEKVKEYFRNLTYLIHLRVLNLGETIVPALGIKTLEGFYDGITPRGLAFDGKGCIEKGHKTPLGKKGVFELIQTPTKMASFQGKNGEQYWYEQEPFLPTELHNVTFIHGQEGLLKSYMKELNTALNDKLGENCSLRSFYAKKHLFNEDILAFEANFGPAEHGMLFELKKDLYRMPHLLIERLFLNECESIAKNGSTKGTFSKIDWLFEQKKLSERGANNLKELFGKVLLSRLENSYVTNSAKSIKDPLITSSKDIDERVCNISFSFCRAVKENFKDQELLHDKVFYSEDPYLFAQIKARLGKYEEVNKYLPDYLQQVPDHVDALMLSATISMRTGDNQAARSDLDQATQIIESLGDDQKAIKIHFFSNLGVLYQRMGAILKATEIVEKAETLIKEDPQSAQSYINNFENLTTFYIRKKIPTKVEEFLDKNEDALKRMKAQTNSHQYIRALAAYNNNRCQFLLFYNKMSESIEHGEKSLALLYEIYGKKHQDVLEMLNGLGHAYFLCGAHERALQYLQEALQSTIELFGESHETFVERYLSLSRVLNKIDPLRGIVSGDYLEKAEKIETLNISIYQKVASAWERINRFDKAKQNLEKAVRIAEKQGSSKDLAFCFNDLASLLYKDPDSLSEAIQYQKRALYENRKIYGNIPSRSVVINLTNLAQFKTHLLSISSVRGRNTRKVIASQLEEAEKMSLIIDKTAKADDLLAQVNSCRGYFEWVIMRKPLRALSFFSNSLEKLETLHGNESIHLIPSLEFLLCVYYELPEKKDEYVRCCMRYFNLRKKHYGESSPEYETARCLFISKH